MGKGKEMITLRELKEKAVSKQQQKLMGLALAYKRGDVPDSEVSDTVKDLAKSMSTKELEDFASTKHKGLPQKVDEAKDPGEYDNEGEMAKNQLQSILRDAEHMIKMFDDEENLPEWVQNKITKAQDYLQSAHSYMMGQDEDDVKESVNEVGFQGNAATAIRVGAVGAAGAAAYAAKKARDRLDPVKVAKARSDRDEKKAEVDKAKQELDQRKKYRQKLRDMQRKQRERQASK